MLADRLCGIDGVEKAFPGPHFHERVLRLDRPVAPVLDAFTATPSSFGASRPVDVTWTWTWTYVDVDVKDWMKWLAAVATR